jgi:hypothetical protein
LPEEATPFTGRSWKSQLGVKISNKEIDNQHNEVKQVRNRICYWTLLFGMCLALFFILIHEKPIGKGLLLGTCFSCINFLLLGRSIVMTIGHSRPRAGLIALSSMLTRYIILSIPLIVAIKSASFNLVSSIIGIFAVQIVTLVYYAVIRPVLDRKRES